MAVSLLTGSTLAAAQSPSAPRDPVGSPGRHTILRADDLFISRRGLGDGGTVAWAQIAPGLDRFGSGIAYAEAFSAAGGMLTSTLFPQARGRFRDPVSDRVLAFHQLSRPSGMIYELAPQNSTVEPGWMGPGEPGGPIPSFRFAVPNPVANTPSALATGDLDGVVDAAGSLHDEAVIAFEGADHSLQVRVVDYNAVPGKATLADPGAELPAIGGAGDSGGAYIPGPLAAGIGDLDADGRNEIAIAWMRRRPPGGTVFGQNTNLQVTILRYTRAVGAAAGNLTVSAPQVRLPDAVGLTGIDYWPSYEMAVADLDGEPGDEIAVSQVGDNRDVAGVSITLLGLDPQFELAHVGQGVLQGTMLRGIPTSSDWRPRLAAGLFHIDPGKGFTLGRRQLALQWLDRQTFPAMQVFDVVRNRYTCSQPGADSPCDLELVALTPQVQVEPQAGTRAMGFAAGGFAGLPATGEPLPWALATSSDITQTVRLWRLTPTPGAPLPFTLAPVGQQGFGDPAVPRAQNPAALGANLTAYDRQARSIVLGAPLELTVQRLPRPTLMFQDPPKHVDWLGGANGRFVNVSRTPEINVTLTDKTGKDFSHKTTHHSDWTIGGSVRTSVKVTASEGLEGIEKAKDSVEVSAGVKGSYERDKSKYDSTGSTYELTVSDATADDDLVGGSYSTLSIWRYPILGRTLRGLDGNPLTDSAGRQLNGFYELQIPGPVETINPPVGGRGLDWYQPLHENGNALSYPQRTAQPQGGLVPLDDLGTFQLPGDKTPKRQALVNVPYAMDDTTPSVELDLTKATGGGSDRSTSGTLAEDAEVKASLYTSVGGTVIPGASVQGTEDLSFNNENSWGTVVTSEHSTESANGFSVEQKGSVLQDRAYNAATAYYYSTSGAQKVVHAVDLTGNQSGRDWWLTNYGKPDPALSLPFRINMIKSDSTNIPDVPGWSASPVHQRLRQFSVVHPNDPDEPLVSGALLNTAPVTGQTVRLQARVYNHSVGSSTGLLPFKARFMALPVDDRGGEIEGKPVKIGDADVGPLQPRQSELVGVDWRVLGPVESSASQQWRIFVILDPENEISNETHEWTDRFSKPPVSDDPIIDPYTGKVELLEAGQNNQGYGDLTVHAPVSAAGSLRAAGAAEGRMRRRARRGRDIHLHRRALAIAQPGARFRRARARAHVDRELMVRVRVEARRRARRHHHLLLYDRPPGRRRGRGRLVGSEVVQGVTGRRGTYVTFTWTPRRAGRHRLFTKVLEHRDDGRRGNARARLDVRVKEVPTRRPRLRVLPAVVRALDLPVLQRRRLATLARDARAALRNGRLGTARRTLLRFAAAARIGRGVSVTRRDVVELRHRSRSILHDLRIEGLARRVRVLEAEPALRRALLEKARRARRAFLAGRPRAARRRLLTISRETRAAALAGGLKRGRPVVVLAKRFASQLR